jgi:hypothetical protein
MFSFMLRWLVLSLAVVAVGCSGEIDNLPTTPDPIIVTETFTGTLTVNGAVTHNVFTLATGTVSATLTSLGDNPPEKVGFSMGTLSGTTCAVVLHNDAAIVSSNIIGTVTSLQGSICVRVHDVGALTEPVSYTFTVTHP